MLAGNEDMSKQLKKLDNKINNVFRFLLKKIDSLHQQEISNQPLILPLGYTG
ncbi:hypothetical protein ES705_13854 [subsurface metagenome]